MHKDSFTFTTNTPLSITHHISTDWTMDMPHYHTCYELNLSISGGNRSFINGYIHEAISGDLFFFSETDIHKNTVPNTLIYDRYILLFDPLLIKEYCRQSPFEEAKDLLYIFSEENSALQNKIHLNPAQLLEFTTLLDHFILMSNTEFYDHPVYLQAKLIEILLYVTNICKKNTNPLTSNRMPSQQVHDILMYIDRHLSEKLTIAKLADLFYINKSYLCELFKKETGFTINQYITAKRIVLSRKLLNDGHSVTDVTAMVGFKNDAYFIRFFKTHTGITPKQYALNSRG